MLMLLLLLMLLQVNAGGVGFYRTVYPESMLDALIPAIKDQTMPPRDRLGLQNDLFALVFATRCVSVVQSSLTYFTANELASLFS